MWVLGKVEDLCQDLLVTSENIPKWSDKGHVLFWVGVERWGGLPLEAFSGGDSLAPRIRN